MAQLGRSPRDFLTLTEKQQVRSGYKTWLASVDGEGLAVEAYTRGLLKHHQLQRLHHEPVSYEKNKLLWHFLQLEDRTYSDVEEVACILKALNNHASTVIAHTYFPDRRAQTRSAQRACDPPSYDVTMNNIRRGACRRASVTSQSASSSVSESGSPIHNVREAICWRPTPPQYLSQSTQQQQSTCLQSDRHRPPPQNPHHLTTRTDTRALISPPLTINDFYPQRDASFVDARLRRGLTSANSTCPNSSLTSSSGSHLSLSTTDSSESPLVDSDVDAFLRELDGRTSSSSDEATPTNTADDLRFDSLHTFMQRCDSHDITLPKRLLSDNSGYHGDGDKTLSSTNVAPFHNWATPPLPHEHVTWRVESREITTSRGDTRYVTNSQQHSSVRYRKPLPIQAHDTRHCDTSRRPAPRPPFQHNTDPPNQQHQQQQQHPLEIEQRWRGEEANRRRTDFESQTAKTAAIDRQCAPHEQRAAWRAITPEQQVTVCTDTQGHSSSGSCTALVRCDSDETRVKQTMASRCAVDRTQPPRVRRPQRWHSQEDLLRMAEHCDDDYVSPTHDRHLENSDVATGDLREQASRFASQPDFTSTEPRSRSRGPLVCVWPGRKRRVSTLRALACCCFRLNTFSFDVEF